PSYAWYLQRQLARAYRILGQSRKALTLLEGWIAEGRAVASDAGVLLELIEDLGWAARDLGEPRRALALLDDYLQRDVPTGRQVGWAVLVERARLNIALGQWAEAE